MPRSTAHHLFVAPQPARRAFLRWSGVAAAAALFAPLLARNASADPPATQAAMQKILGARTAKPGRITLDLPLVAENGNAVALGVSVDSKMTEAEHVTGIHVFADNNPAPEVASYALSPANGKAAIATRIRLARSQNVIVLAEFNDGSVAIARSDVRVTIGGCGAT